jgi:hypothetical protein
MLPNHVYKRGIQFSMFWSKTFVAIKRMQTTQGMDFCKDVHSGRWLDGLVEMERPQPDRDQLNMGAPLVFDHAGAP